jgi:glutamate carboxypeptidase
MDLADDLLAWCTERQGEMVELLRRLVDTPSHAAQPDGVRRVAELLGEHLAPIGVRLEEHAGRPVAPELAWLEPIMSPEAPYEQLAASYVARRGGDGRDTLLLLGDLDTSAPEGSVAALPFGVRGERAYGAGIADMKGGLVVMVTALRALAAHGARTPPIRVVLAGDEQAGSLSSRALIEHEARSARWCLCFECARDGGRLMHSRGHIGVGRVVARGREAHTGSAHESGRNAIEALARAIPGLNALTRAEDGTFVTVTLVSGGRRRSVVPALATAVIDVRTPSVSAWAALRERIEEVVAEAAVPGVETEVTVHDHRPGFTLGEGGKRLLDVVRSAGRRLGMTIESQASAAAGSSAFAGALDVPTVDGMGPSGGDMMTVDEYVELPSLAPRAALAALVVSTLAS